MPVSKKPRKKGRHGRENALMKGLAKRKKFASVDDARDFIGKSFDQLIEIKRQRRPGLAQIHYLTQLADREELLEAFTKAFYCLDRWPTTDDTKDFNVVSSSLMLGVLCHKRMDVQEQDLLHDLQRAAFMAVTCARMKNKGEQVPVQNLESVRIGLTTAQALMEYAYENDRQAFIDVLRHNDRDHVESTPGLLEAHERLILGQNYDTVQRWEAEDGLLYIKNKETAA